MGAARAQLDLAPGDRIVLYPGDLEVSSGADLTRQLVAPLTRLHPDVVVVFAYRNKTPAAAIRATELRRSLAGARVRITDQVRDMHALLAASGIVIFPVDDLWGKVDQPIVLLEAMSLGIPTLVLDRGPLRDVAGAEKVADIDADAWLTATSSLLTSSERRALRIAEGRAAASTVYASGVVARGYEAIYLRALSKATSGAWRSH
jgi:phosphatidylinositol alpha-1,6-mannosyltransferase